MRHPPPRDDAGAQARRRRVRRRGRWLIALALLATALAWLVLDPGAAPADLPPALATAAPPPHRAAEAAPPPPFSAAGEQARAAQRAVWRERLALAQQTLEAYRAGSRYPRSSQPLALQSDQAFPNAPVEEELPLSPSSQGDRRLSLRTSQEKVFVQGAESVAFTISARDPSGATVPLRILHASAREIAAPSVGSLYPVVPMDFNDEGRDGDVASGDGSFGVRLQPGAQGFAGLTGQIRVEAVLQADDQQGTTYFDVYYTAVPPAVWRGGVRDALEDGSLSIYLPVDVREAGRYVAKARVDDANGVPLALLTFNDELAQGAQEMRMTLFGKLVRDAKPAFPVVVRDVDAFLLRPDAFPDRSLMPRLEGRVHTSGDYDLASFADAEWNGEERARYLSELGRDVADAEEQLKRLSKP